MIPRMVEPELLDALPPEDPRAIHSRRDLRVINRWMGNARHLATAIRSLPFPLARVVELGTGDGTLLLKLANVIPAGTKLELVDMEPVVAPATLRQMEANRWDVQIVRSRLEAWLASSPQGKFDLVIANLILHHFKDDQLRQMFLDLAGRTRAFVSCDPRRWLPALWSTSFLWLLGCNSVTRYDATVSVRAGFRDRELSKLWPQHRGFEVTETAGGYASHLFVARCLPDKP